MPDRLLFVSYAFPPLAAPEAVLSAKAAHGLHGCEVDVVAVRPARWQAVDDELVEWAESAASTVHRVPVPWWLPAAQPHPAVRRFPDAMRFLRRRAVQMVESLDPDGYDAMVTWSQWHSVHLAGLAIKAAHPSLPWLVHLSDPWVDNPLLPASGLARRVAERHERAVVGAADGIEFTSAETLEATMARHPGATAATAVVPHLFDESLFPDTELAADGPSIVVRHIGSFYGDRRPHPLLRAAAALVQECPDLGVRLRLQLIGPISRDVRRSMVDLGLREGAVTIVARVPYRESLRLMRTSDLLAVVDAPATRSVFLPSKVVDYIGAARPIVALTPPGAAADAVRAAGGWVADPADPAACLAALHQAVEAAAAVKGQPWGDPITREGFGVRAVGEQRRALLRRISEARWAA